MSPFSEELYAEGEAAIIAECDALVGAGWAEWVEPAPLSWSPGEVVRVIKVILVILVILVVKVVKAYTATLSDSGQGSEAA